MNSGMIAPAARMKNAVIAPRTISMIQNSVEASRNASLRRPCWSRSVNTGTNAADSAALANRLLTRFGIWKAIVNADAGPLVPKKLAATISRTSPATREMPVAIEKIAVLRATPAAAGRRRGRRLLGEASSLADKAAIVRRCAAPGHVCLRAVDIAMANIHSQKKRILRSERERLENRRYTSAIKTYFRRLQELVAEGDAGRGSRPSTASS